MTGDQTMAEVLAAVATAEARRTGLVQFVEHDGAVWHVYPQGNPPIPGSSSLAVVLPGDDRMGIAKRILAAKQSGLCVPQAVLALVGAARPPEPPKPQKTKAALAAAVAPPPPIEPVRPVEPRFDPPPHEWRPAATVQGELF